MSKRETPDAQTEVMGGIPCGVVVDSYMPGRPAHIGKFPGAGFGDAEPPKPEEIEWHLVDRKGYAARWLEEKLSEQDERDITDWLLEQRQ